jgi:hypothetical protein
MGIASFRLFGYRETSEHRVLANKAVNPLNLINCFLKQGHRTRRQDHIVEHYLNFIIGGCVDDTR